jgi:hypothetical protein
MFKKVSKFLAVTLALSMLFTVSTESALASNANKHHMKHEKHESKHTNTHKSQQPSPQPAPESEVEPVLNAPLENGQQGIGAFRVGKTAVVLALKYGGPAVSKILSQLSPRNAKLLKEWSYTLGDKLEHMTDRYEARLVDFMIHELGFSQSAARNIAWAIATLI